MKTTFHHILCVLLAVSLLSACKPRVPAQYVQPGDMEDVLYDYYYAQGMAQLPGGLSEDIDYKKALYFNAVLEKHGITEAEFDSSMVYYYTRADRFVKIMKRVQERLADDALKYGASAGEVERFTANSLTGDTANIWLGERSFMLVPYAPYNRVQFFQKADTAFRKGDSFMLVFNSNFLYQSGSKDATAYLSVKYESDSVVTSNIHFSSDGVSQVRISSCKEKVKEVKGFLYLGQGYEKTSALRMLLVSNIQLIRFHEKTKSEEPKQESAPQMSPADSIRQIPDSLHPRRHKLGERPLPMKQREEESLKK